MPATLTKRHTSNVARQTATAHAPMLYLQGYPPDTIQQVSTLLQAGTLGPWLLQRYPQAHNLRTDSTLFAYVQQLRQQFMRGAEPLHKVVFDSKLQTVRNALGTHTTAARVQGGRLKAKREIRVASVFKDVPLEFLQMIAVHELAHLREADHNKAFYQLCQHMMPRYHATELEVRMYLTYLDATGHRLWVEDASAATGSHTAACNGQPAQAQTMGRYTGGEKVG